eukprot:g1521.t1 g1521   contig10:2267209-2268231(-)
MGTSNKSRDVEPHQHSLTTLRKTSAPYLPPPLLQFIHTIDTYAHVNHESIATNDYFNSEPSMAVVSTFLMAFFVLKAIKGLQNWWINTTKRSTAHLSGDGGGVLGAIDSGNGEGGLQSGKSMGHVPSFQETVVLCGAVGSGKTALLHLLCSPGEKTLPPMTITSLVASVGYIGKSSKESGDETAVRVIDYPGHPSLSSQLSTLLLPITTSRLVFAMDATQPVTEGVALLYQSILNHSQIRRSWSDEGKKLIILVVCTKSDGKGAKNYKRMKIQVRNELDRLRKVDLALDSDGSAALDVKGKLDLDNLESLPVSLHFVETGFGDANGFKAVRNFVLSGALP